MPRPRGHVVSIIRSTAEPGECRAMCACGWSIAGEADYVREESASHAAGRRREMPRIGPPLRHAGFVSGLPDDPRSRRWRR